MNLVCAFIYYSTTSTRTLTKSQRIERVNRQPKVSFLYHYCQSINFFLVIFLKTFWVLQKVESVLKTGKLYATDVWLWMFQFFELNRKTNEEHPKWNNQYHDCREQCWSWFQLNGKVSKLCLHKLQQHNACGLKFDKPQSILSFIYRWNHCTSKIKKKKTKTKKRPKKKQNKKK